MKKETRLFRILPVFITLAVVFIAVFIYARQLNKAVEKNTINMIHELAEHDRKAIRTYIEDCWRELEQMVNRFEIYDCQSIRDVEIWMNLECSASRFTHIYMLAEDGRIYTDKFVVYDPENDNVNGRIDLLPYFANGEKRIVSRFDDKLENAGLAEEYLLYGVRLDGYEIGGIRMEALVGITDINDIQNSMIIDSFIKNGVKRGYSSVIDKEGNYVVNIQRTIYLNQTESLYQHLSRYSGMELTNEQIAQKIENEETFSFYYINEENIRKRLYFMPFSGGIDWYFIMSVNTEVFSEQSRTFVTMSLVMMVICIFSVAIMLLLLLSSRTKRLRAAERAKAQSEFLSNMSHEIRTPLNGLIGLNHLLMLHIDEPEQMPQIKDWLKKSHGTANYLLSLVNDILDMSKLQSGRADIFNSPILMDEMLEAVRSMQRDNIESRGVTFIVEKELLVPWINSDETRIKQVLMNIVGNAAKFTPRGGTIRLSVSQKLTDDTHVTTIYRCADTGVGMSKEFLEKIFDSFSQERNKSSKTVKGTGLGMAISKLLVDAMGGTIQVESKLNEGSVFTVSIPSEIVEPAPDYAENSMDEKGAVEAEAKLQESKPVKILLAEDNELNAEILIAILSEEGYEVVHAENGQETVAKFQESEIGEFDIILMDMQMPVMDGCTASEKIRGLDRTDAKTVIIFACTANSFKEDRDRAINSGMNDFLAKPIDVKTMLDKIKSCRRA